MASPEAQAFSGAAAFSVGYVHTADSGNGGIKGPLPAFLNPLPVTESAAAGGNVPPPMAPATQDLSGPFRRPATNPDRRSPPSPTAR